MLYRALFVDCVVQCGSNPAVMLIKELVESEQITGHMATWALAAIGYYIKTPTLDLLQELVVCFFDGVIPFKIIFILILAFCNR